MWYPDLSCGMLYSQISHPLSSISRGRLEVDTKDCANWGMPLHLERHMSDRWYQHCNLGLLGSLKYPYQVKSSLDKWINHDKAIESHESVRYVRNESDTTFSHLKLIGHVKNFPKPKFIHQYIHQYIHWYPLLSISTIDFDHDTILKNILDLSFGCLFLRCSQKQRRRSPASWMNTWASWSKVSTHPSSPAARPRAQGVDGVGSREGKQMAKREEMGKYTKHPRKVVLAQFVRSVQK